MRVTGAKQIVFLQAPKILVALLWLCITAGSYAAEPATDEVLQECRRALSSEKGAMIVHWSNEPLPQNYRQAAEFNLRNGTVGGWLAHVNPNRTSTIVIHVIDRDTQEGNFIILVKNNNVILKDVVFAFEFALSNREHNGMTGLFFCNKTGPSDEWVWDGKNWR